MVDSPAWLVAVDPTVSFGVAIFEIAVATVLWRTDGDRRVSARLLAGLFAVNAAVHGLAFVNKSGALNFGAIAYGIDSLTGPLLVAYLAHRFLPKPWARYGSLAFLAAGGVLAVLATLGKTIEMDLYVRALPLFAAWALIIALSATGDRIDRWVALAFGTRGIYWGVHGIHRLADSGIKNAHPEVVGIVALGLAGVFATFRMAKSEDPDSTTVLALFGGSALAALGEITIANLTYGLLFIDTLFLSLIRGVLVIMAFQPRALLRITSLTIGGTAAAVVGMHIVRFAAFNPAGPAPNVVQGAIITGLGAGIVTVTALATKLHQYDQTFLQLSPSLRLGPGVVLGGRYRIERSIDPNPARAVFLVKDRKTRQRVVAKVEESVRGAPNHALAEAKILEKIHHPNVLQVLDAVEEPTYSALITEYVDGGSLKTRLTQGPLGPSEFLALANGLLAGMAHLHANGVVHGDLKPSNILLSATGAKIADFGISRVTDQDLTLTVGVQKIVGTPLYMAPEVASGARAGPASDVFGIGAVLREALTGAPHLAHDQRDDANILALRAARQSLAAPIEGLAPEWQAWLDRALAPESRKRAADAEELLRSAPLECPPYDPTSRAPLST